MTSASWAELAYDIVIKVAKTHQEFTPDDIWKTGLQKPIEARALGGVMARARREGIIEKTGRVQPTRQVESHGTDVTIWKSLIFKQHP
ncbi:hypothetical protein [Pseudomonas syringae]|uniref:hypothetical protein n=1 Tax=Pseudomonas syringae TaxID=317 RepID=UPI001F105757|nr:hypothetical protein [Pseudomonas syringae]MCH5516937.1 hypothetical protein [Pseudomonas syringae pv. syringae]MCH5630071.1 hypothetical protein [Pseudomonas syringae pv. syringae]